MEEYISGDYIIKNHNKYNHLPICYEVDVVDGGNVLLDNILDEEGRLNIRKEWRDGEVWAEDGDTIVLLVKSYDAYVIYGKPESILCAFYKDTIPKMKKI